MNISFAALYIFLITAMCSKSLYVDVADKNPQFNLPEDSPTKMKRGVFNLIPKNQLLQNLDRPFLNKYGMLSFYSRLQLNPAKRSQGNHLSSNIEDDYNQRSGVKSLLKMKRDAILSQLLQIQSNPNNFDENEPLMKKSVNKRGVFNLIHHKSPQNNKLSFLSNLRQSLDKRGVFNIIPQKSASRQRQTRTFPNLKPNRKPPTYISKYRAMYSSKLPSSKSKHGQYWIWNTFFNL